MSASVNHWPDSRCAKAFWGQHELPPYQELLRDTTAWLDPAPGERWLDLGCGGGQLTRALWEKSRGQLAEVVGVDVAAVNGEAYARLRGALQPPASADRVRFVAADFSGGFRDWTGGQFDGIVSGLSLQYAEAYSAEQGAWTQAAYDAILAEVRRLLKPGGRFVFSVNVPEPAWGKVAWHSFTAAFRSRRPLQYLKRSWRMWSYGRWLSREARHGRFHYLPIDALVTKLEAAGLGAIEHRLSYVGQAYIIRCRPAAAAAVSAA